MPTKINSQLTLNDRIYIQSSILNKLPASRIAKCLNVARQTIYRELHRNSTHKPRSTFNVLVDCGLRQNCPQRASMKLNGRIACYEKCELYQKEECRKLTVFPFVCNSCELKNKCIKSKTYYDAGKAHEKYLDELAKSRQGIHISKDDFSTIDGIVSPLIQQGQSLNHILTNHPEINVSEVTVRNWINGNIMSCCSIDLPKKTRFKVNKQYIPRVVKDPKLIINRTYKDFLNYVKNNPELHIVQVDTVYGKKGDKNCLLTIYFPDIHFMFGYLIDSLSPNNINLIFNSLKIQLSVDRYKAIFPIILSDNGFEFLKLPDLECNWDTGEIITRVFYCDPYRSSQKGACERNHEFIRYIKAKGKTLDNITQSEVDVMFSHINSISRKSILGRCPYDLALNYLGFDFLKAINITRIHQDSVYLKPDLFSKEKR